VGLRLCDEPAELVQQGPLLLIAGVYTAPVRREWLAGGTSREESYRTRFPEASKLSCRDCSDILLEKPRLDIRLKRVSTPVIGIEAGSDRYAGTAQTV
jgi:hypothetical protein